MRGWRPAVATVALAVVGSGLAGCGRTTERKAVSAARVEGGTGFAPERVTVDRGNRVLLSVGNRTDRQHGFAIEGMVPRRRTVDPGQRLVVRFTATRSGTFKIYCHLHQTHLPATLVVR